MIHSIATLLHNKSFILPVEGSIASGKTTFSKNIAQLIDKNYITYNSDKTKNIERRFFEPPQTSNLLFIDGIDNFNQHHLDQTLKDFLSYSQNKKQQIILTSNNFSYHKCFIENSLSILNIKTFKKQSNHEQLTLLSKIATQKIKPNP